MDSAKIRPKRFHRSVAIKPGGEPGPEADHDLGLVLLGAQVSLLHAGIHKDFWPKSAKRFPLWGKDGNEP
jgi:hypothetical protein